MLSISFMNDNSHVSYASDVLRVIEENKPYIKFFNKGNWEEASQRMFIQAMKHPKNPDTLLPYIKKLSREIMKKTKKEQMEFISDVYNEKGDINFIYTSLQEDLDISEIDGAGEIYNALKDIYLIDKEAFVKLRYLYDYDSPEEIQDLRRIKERNKEVFNAVNVLMVKYGVVEVSKVIQKFLEDIPCLTQPVAETIKTIEIKQKNKNVLEKLIDKAVIEYEDPRKGVQGLDVNFLTVGDPDYNKWGIKGQSKYNIVKIDISSYMEYIYREIFVDMGVNTRHIQWCGDSYRLDTPAGEYYINLDRDKFITKVRVELLTNLMHNSLHILAVTEDNVYLKVKKFGFTTLRVAFKGKVIDMPVTLYK